MSDYYEMLGVEPGADKDAIRAAYRDALEGASAGDRARLNRAWNVLSDPVQRGRYDEAREEGWLDDAEDEDGDEEAESAPSRPARQPLGGPAQPPTVVLPAGMHLAEKRARGNALLIDFLILFVIMTIAQFAIVPKVYDSRHPEQMDRIERLNDRNQELDDRKSEQDKIADGEATDATDGEKPTAAEQRAAERESKRLDDQIGENNDRVVEIQKDFTGTNAIIGIGLLATFLAILVPATAMTGQTLGMRLRKVRVVRVDGSPVGWPGAFARFAVPIAIALLLPTLGAILGIGMVLWFFRDRNGQGFHDKLAKTLVVNATS